MKTNFPQHDKLRAIQTDSQICADFIDFLEMNQISLCKCTKNDTYYPVFESKEKLLAKYFEIDLIELEKEKREILDGLRALQK